MAVRIMTVVCQKRRWKLCDVVNGPQKKKKLLMEEIWETPGLLFTFYSLPALSTVTLIL